PLFDSGTADGFLYYVMPYVQGETLRSKLDRETQLGIDEAVRITREVADALDYAHRHGVIHRDIKPENILLHDGRPMVADFGIALAVSAAAGGRMTETGLSLGTPHYMSPEQATAEKELSNRSDIYSLGCVLYEMLTGSPPHVGASAQQIIMKIVTEDAAPVSKLRKSVPPNVEAAVAKAIEKLPADRFESARDFAAALTDVRFTSTTLKGPAGAERAGAQRMPFALAGWAVAALLAVALAWSVFGSAAKQPAPSIRFAFSPGAMSDRIDIDISPDGRRVVVPGATGRSGAAGIAVHDLGSLESITLPGTPGGERPRISPDGRWISYRGEGILRKVPVEGGPLTTISNRCTDSADWIDVESLICTTNDWGLGRVSSAGGTVEVLAAPDTAGGEIGLWSVAPLPGGRAVLFTSYRRPANRIEAYDLRSRTRHVLVEDAVMARYSKSGHLLFVRDNALFAIRFDPKALRTLGTAVPVLDNVATLPFDAVAGFAIADNGTLAVVRQSEWTVPRRVVWVGRDGVEQPAIPAAGEYQYPRIAPDQQKLLVTLMSSGHRDLWVFDLRRALLTQLTRSTSSAFRGVWTPDGRQIVYTNETPSYDVYRVPADGSAPPVAVVANQKDKYADAVSPDGAYFVGEEQWAGVRRVMLRPLDGSNSGRAVSDSSLLSFHPSFSPDGRWIAYSEGGEVAVRRIVVRRTDGTGAALQVSAGGDYDVFPRWTKGGREIVFRRKSAVYAVDLDAAAGHVGVERKLFDGPYPVALGYDVTPDGSRFVMVRLDPRPEALPILIITNFFAELNAKVPR
ncbi:MAG TPA: protein kinase, partial [Gemmatimonadales bacterium]